MPVTSSTGSRGRSATMPRTRRGRCVNSSTASMSRPSPGIRVRSHGSPARAESRLELDGPRTPHGEHPLGSPTVVEPERTRTMIGTVAVLSLVVLAGCSTAVTSGAGADGAALADAPLGIVGDAPATTLRAATPPHPPRRRRRPPPLRRPRRCRQRPRSPPPRCPPPRPWRPTSSRLPSSILRSKRSVRAAGRRPPGSSSVSSISVSGSRPSTAATASPPHRQ
jgi:hypothetical protein